MAFDPITVMVDDKPVRLVKGTEVRHALNWVGGHQLVAQVAGGKKRVWDETAGAPTDLGGALYDGQRLIIR